MKRLNKLALILLLSFPINSFAYFAESVRDNILIKNNLKSYLHYINMLRNYNECEITGATKFPSEAYISGIVTFSSARIQKQVTTDAIKSSNYKIKLPAGIYDVSLTVGKSEIYKRSRIKIDCKEKLDLNVFAFPVVEVDVISIDGSEKSSTSKAFGFDSFSKPFLEKDDLNIVIAYQEKKQAGDLTFYKDAMLTYNNYTIWGYQIIQNTTERSFTVTGTNFNKAWLDDGKGHKKESEKISIKFSNNTLKLLKAEKQ